MTRLTPFFALVFSLCAALSCPAQLPTASPAATPPPSNVPGNLRPAATPPMAAGGASAPRASATPFAGFGTPTPAPAAGSAPAGTLSPLDQPLQDQVETTITCELTRAPTKADTQIFSTPKEADAAKGVWHYKLWLPQGYTASGTKKWPCMFIMSPQGNAAMGQMSNHLKSKGYVVVLLVESKNGPWGPVVGDFLAAHDDVVKRVRIEEGRKFATGFSGGARGSSLFAVLRPGFGGLILQGAGAAPIQGGFGYDVSGLKRSSKLYIAMTMGDKDNNRKEIEQFQRDLAAPARFTVIDFPGIHQWAPQEAFEKAITWVEQKNGM